MSNQYLATIRYTRGLGSSAVYVRIRDTNGNYLVLATGVWQASEDATCKQLLSEYQDADTAESRYQYTLSLPLISVQAVMEYVLVAGESVIGEDDLSASFIGASDTGTAYASIDDVRAYMNVSSTGSDALLSTIILECSSEVDDYTGRDIYGDFSGSIPMSIQGIVIERTAFRFWQRSTNGQASAPGAGSFLPPMFSQSQKTILDRYTRIAF